MAWIRGTVTDAFSDLPVPDVLITASGPTPFTRFTRADGTYGRVRVRYGSYTVSAEKAGYQKATRTFWLPPLLTLVIDFSLNGVPAHQTGTHSGRVVNAQGMIPIQGAIITLGLWTGMSGLDGLFQSASLPAGTYHRVVSAVGFVSDMRDITVLAGQNVHVGAILQPQGSPPPPPPIPAASLSATPTTITSGEHSTLTWSTANATTAVIAPDIGMVPLFGSHMVIPNTTTTYVLTVTGPGGMATTSVTVNVLTTPPPSPPPVIAFSVSPTTIPAGGMADLTWNVQNATAVSIDQGIGAVAASGTRHVMPGATVTYTLTAAGPGGTRTATAMLIVTPPTPPPPSPIGNLWSALSTWQILGIGSRFPTRNDRITVPAGFTLINDTDDSEVGSLLNRGLLRSTEGTRRLRLFGNLEVRGEGRLEIGSDPNPFSGDMLFQWVNVDESRFVGATDSQTVPSDPVSTDHGLWVMDDGVLALYGEPCWSWGWLQAGVLSGDTLLLAQDPTGWHVGHEIVIAPTRPPYEEIDGLGRRSVLARWTEFDRATIRSISGRTITLMQPLQFPHPAKTLRDGRVFTAEVAYLGRSVRFEGLGRADHDQVAAGHQRMHVFIHSMRPQTAKHVAVRHFGPRREMMDFPGHRTKVLGRYGWHHHHAFDAARGSLYEGLALYDGGNHGYVPHLSHGIAFPRCVGFNVMEGIYWWDEPLSTDPPWPSPQFPRSNASHDIDWSDTLGMLMPLDFRGSPAGQVGIYLMNAGNGNRCRRVRAVGAAPGAQVGGWHWNDDAADVRLVFGIGNVWDWGDNVGHNNGHATVTDWQNDTEPHILERYVAYHDGTAGTDHGAYLNNYLHRDFAVEDCGEQAVVEHALGHNPGRPGLPQVPYTLTMERGRFSCAGAPDRRYAFRFVEHTGASERRMQVRECIFEGYTVAAIADEPPQPSTEPTVCDFVNCTFESGSRAFWIADIAHVGCDIRCQPDPRTGSGALRIRHRNTGLGTVVAEWNARVESIPSFA